MKNNYYECNGLRGYQEAHAAWNGEKIWFLPSGSIALGARPHPKAGKEITIEELARLAAIPTK